MNFSSFKPLRFGGLLVGPQDPQTWWFTRKTRFRSCHNYGYSLLQEEETDQNQQREKAHVAKSRRNQAQASRCPLTVELHGAHLILPVMMCYNRCQTLPTRDAHLSHVVQHFYWKSVTCSAHMTDLSYSDSSPLQIKNICHKYILIWLNWYNMTQSLRLWKHSYQAEYSKGSEIISQEPPKDQSWR